MDTRIIVAFTVLFLCGICNASSLWNAIKDSKAPISEFRKLVEELRQESYINEDMTTCFVPTDTAMKKRFPNLASMKRDDKIDLLKYQLATLKKGKTSHLIQTSVFTDETLTKEGKADIGIGKFVVLESRYELVPLYMVRSKKTDGSYEYFVNNAKFVDGEYDKTVSKGAFHVINEVIYPLGNKVTFSSYLGSHSDKYKTFLDLIKLFEDDRSKSLNEERLLHLMTHTRTISTIFVPNNNAFTNIPKATMDGIKANVSALAQFFASHLAPEQVIFSSWMEYRPSVSMKMYNLSTLTNLDGTIYLNKANQKKFVSYGGVTAEVLSKETQSLGSGLMLEINQPLGLLYRTVRLILSSKASAFLSACDGIKECKDYIDGVNGECTVFAPATFPSSLTKLSKEMLKKVVLLHILPNRRLTMATMPASTVEYNGAMDSGKLRFNQMLTDTWIEGRLTDLVDNVYSQGFVGSKIRDADVAATNGVVQVINKHLGYPTESIYQVLRNRYSNFSKLLGYFDSDFDIDFKTLNSVKQRYTLFAPTNAALTEMEGTETGRKILETDADRKRLLKRLILLNTVLLTNLTLNQKYEATTALPFEDQKGENVRMTIFVTQNRELGKDASINIGVQNNDAVLNPSKSEFGATNGIVYVLNKIPYGSTITGRACKSVLCVAVGNQVSWFIVLMVVSIGQALLRTQ